MRGKIPKSKVIQLSRACFDENKPNYCGILSLSIGLFSFLITTNDQLDCNILISLLLEEKSLKIASKLGFLAPGLEKWTKVVQARILVKNGRSSTPALGPLMNLMTLESSLAL